MFNPARKTSPRSAGSDILYPFLIVLALSTLSALSPALLRAAETAPTLKSSVVVEGALVTLGDLFENAGNKGHVAVFRSPDPGTTGKVSVRRIVAAAKAQGMKVSLPATPSMVTIRRSSRVIELAELEDLIRGRLETSLPPSVDSQGRLVIRLPKGLKDLHVDPTLQGELSLSSFDWSARSGRFTARFQLAGNAPIIIRGTASMMVETGVTTRDVSRGEILSASDLKLTFVKARANKSRSEVSLRDMIGLAAKRRLRKGRPVTMADLEAPKLITKNQLVTILLDIPGLVLRTEGKALGDAAKGEAVKVLNTQSRRIIHATATAPGLVSVTIGPSAASGS